MTTADGVTDNSSKALIKLPASKQRNAFKGGNRLISHAPSNIN